ncbi:MAG: hypothetical protein ACQGVC_09175 [Myxococcota bacterium]
MRADLFQPSDEAEARILLLIEAFSRGSHVLEGRTKLAKLDFFLRYPSYLRRALEIRRKPVGDLDEDAPDLETRMVRYRYGPWDPSFYAVLGRLIGKRLVDPVPSKRGIAFRVTDRGRELAQAIASEPVWEETNDRLDLLRRHLNLKGTTLKNFIYDNFPEVTNASWGDSL